MRAHGHEPPMRAAVGLISCLIWKEIGTPATYSINVKFNFAPNK